MFLNPGGMIEMEPVPNGYCYFLIGLGGLQVILCVVLLIGLYAALAAQIIEQTRFTRSHRFLTRVADLVLLGE